MNASLRRRNRNLALLALLSVLAYLPVIAGVLFGGWPFFDDSITLFNVWRGLSHEALHAGHLPFWNPYVFCGLPLMANNQSAVLYLPNVIYWVLPVAPAMLLDAIVHNIWLAWGGYALGRAWKLSRTSSFFMAAVLALGGGVAAHVFNGHLTWHAVRSWLPWQLCFLSLYLSTADGNPHRARRYALLLAGCVAAQAYSGYPPIMVVSLAFCGGLLLSWAALRGLPRGWFSTALWVGVLGVALSAAAILPLDEVSGLSVHGEAMGFKIATDYSGTWRTLARLVLPGFFGNNVVPQWSLRNLPHEEVGFVGILPLLLAVGAPIFARRSGKVAPYIWILVAVLLLTAIMAMGRHLPLYQYAYQYLPLVKKTRVPVRWIEVSYYVAALLSGLVFESLLRRRTAGATAEKILLGALASVCAVCTLLFAVVLISGSTSNFWVFTVQKGMSPGPKTMDEKMQFAQSLHASALSESLIGMVVTGMILCFVLKWRSASTTSAKRRCERLVIALVGLELLGYFWRATQIIPAQPLREIFTLPTQLMAREYSKEERWETILNYGLMNNLSLHGVPVFNGYDALGQTKYFEFVNQVENKKLWIAMYEVQKRTPLLRVASVSTTIADHGEQPPVHEKFPDFLPRRGAAQGKFQLWEWQGAWPRAYVTRNLHRVGENQQLPLLEKWASADFAAQNRPAVVAPGAFSQIAAQPLTERDFVTKWHYDWNRVTLDTRAAAPSLLVFNDIMYPGWTAAVNGKIVPMEAANYLFRGVEVPAGDATVQMVYEPQTMRVALFLSLCGLMGLSALSMIYFTPAARRTARPRQSATPS